VTGFLFLGRGEREAASGRFYAYTNVCSPLAPGERPPICARQQTVNGKHRPVPAIRVQEPHIRFRS
jgi:hypothetical protein